MALIDFLKLRRKPAPPPAPEPPQANINPPPRPGVDVMPDVSMLGIDENARTDFGLQVASMMALEADKFAMAPTLREFHHDVLAGFVILDDGRVVHAPHLWKRAQGAVDYGVNQRYLTMADSKAILDGLKFLVTRGVTIPQKAALTPSTQAAQQPAQITPSRLGGLSSREMAELQKLYQAEYMR